MIQIVFAKWGAMYGAGDVNRLVRAIREHTTEPVRIVCFTERPDDGYEPSVEVRPFPKFALPFEEMKKGCRLKLSAFAPGVLNPDDPAILLDLDAMVCGDLARVAGEVRRRPNAFHMTANHFLPLWRVQRRLRPVLGEYHYFGHASVTGYLPRNFEYIFSEFNRLVAQAPIPPPKRLATDERFMSYAARDRVRVMPRRVALKFTDEYMVPLLAFESLRSMLPWVRSRRRSAAVIDFVGPTLKPWALAKYQHGEIVTYGSRRKVRWVFDAIGDYWRRPVA